MTYWFSLGAKKPGLSKASLEPEDDAHRKLSRRFQDLSDTRDKYEGFLARAQNLSGAAFDFASSLEDMASYMIETFGEFIDPDIGNVSSILGDLQMEISKLIKIFIQHVSETIVKPSEATITELQEAEVLKERYINAWNSFKLSKSEKKQRKGKGSQGSELLEEVKKQANIFNAHIQYLFLRQSQDLLTQLARYHTSQLHLFRNGLQLINEVEPRMKRVAQERKIHRTLVETTTDETVVHQKIAEKSKNDDETSISTSQRYLGPQCNSSDSSGEINYEDKRPEGNSISAPSSPLLHYKSSDECDSVLPTYALPPPTSMRAKWTPHTTQLPTDKGSGAKVYYSGNIIDAYKTETGTKAYYSQGLGDNARHRQLHTPTFVEVVDDVFRDEKSGKYSHSATVTCQPSANVKYTPTSNVCHQMELNPGRSSYTVSPPSPQISELHKLPLPPPTPCPIQFSAPLPRRELPNSRPLSPLPPPPTVTRSLSIPSTATSSREYY